MESKKNVWTPFKIHFLNSMIVAVLFIGVHFLCYGFKDPSAYKWSVMEMVILVLLAIGYAYLYERVSSSWRWDYSKGFVNVKGDGKHHDGDSWTNLFNSMIFAVLVIAILITGLTMAGILVSIIYVDFLDGIRGAVPPLTPLSAGSLAAQVVVTTTGLELIGKTEGQPPRNP
jgi:hypothetical protein